MIALLEEFPVGYFKFKKEVINYSEYFGTIEYLD